MHVLSLLLTFFVAGSAFASPTDATLITRAVCKAPKCKAFCPDGTAYDCCVDYIRDPCADHDTCYCADGVTSYICDAEYLVDPCAGVTAS